MPSARIEPSPRAEAMMTKMRPNCLSALIARVSESPVMTGIIQSTIAASGIQRRTSARPAAPSPAVRTSYPCEESVSTSMSRYRASSSITAIRPGGVSSAIGRARSAPPGSPEQGFQLFLHDVVGEPVDLRSVDVVRRRRDDPEVSPFVHVAPDGREGGVVQVAGEKLPFGNVVGLREVDRELVDAGHRQRVLVLVGELLELEDVVRVVVREADRRRGGLGRPDVVHP